MTDKKINFVQSDAFFYSAVVHIAILLTVLLYMLLKPTSVDEQTTIEIDVLASMPEALQENAPQDASNPEASKTEAAVAERKATSPSSPVQPEPLPEPVKAASASAPAQLEPLQAPFKVAVAAANVTRDPLEERAQNGNADAQYQMAIRYKDGTGVQANDETAAKWFLAAAAQSHADAQYWAGVYTYHGRGTAMDRPRARQWLENAAAQGHAGAQVILAAPPPIRNPRNPYVSTAQSIVYAAANTPVRGYPFGTAIQQRPVQQIVTTRVQTPTPTHLYSVSERSVRSALRESYRTGTPLVIHAGDRLSRPLHITPQQAGSRDFTDWLLCDVLKLQMRD